LQKLKISLTPKSKKSDTASGPAKQTSTAVGPKKSVKKKNKESVAAEVPLVIEGHVPNGHIPRGSPKAVSKPAGAIVNGVGSSVVASKGGGSHKVTEYFSSLRRSERKPKPRCHQGSGSRVEARLGSIHDPVVESALVAEDDSRLPIAVREFEGKGRGVVAERDFERGEFVVEYAGELICVGEAQERETAYSMDTTKGCYMYYFKHRSKQYW